MLLWKSFLILFSGLMISVPGLLVFISGFLTAQDDTSDKTIIKFQEKKLSKSFYQVERSLRFENYDRTAIPKKIADITSQFEREYLQSLIKKREENFSSQYNLLLWQLNYMPEYFSYYDELVAAARSNGKLNELKEHSARLKSKNIFKIYLTALIEHMSGDYNESINTLKIVTHPAKEIHYLKAQSLRALGNYNSALIELNAAETLAGNNRDYLSKIFNSKGSLLFLSGPVDKAEAFYKKAYETAKQASNAEEETKALVNLGIIADEYGDVVSARKSIKQAIGIIDRIQNPELRAFAYSELGVSYSLTNEIIDAKKYYEKGYHLYKKMNNNERLSLLSSNLAAIYSQLSNHIAALKHYEEGSQLAGKNNRAQILNLNGIGDVYANLGNYSKALNYYEKAKRLSLEIKDVNSAAAVDASIGTLLYNIGKPRKAIEYYNNAAEIIDAQTNPYNAADLYFKTGLAYTDIDSFKAGTDYYFKGLELAKSSGDIYNEIIISTGLAHNLLLTGNLEEADGLLKQIKNKTSQYGLTQVSNIQDLYHAKILIKRNETKKAVPLLSRVVNSSTSISDYNTQIEAGYLLAQIYVSEKNDDEALKQFNQTIKLIDELSRPLFGNPEIQISHFSSLNEIFASFAEYLYDTGKEKEAFEIVERSRSRNTLQNLNNIKISSAINDEELLNRLYDLDWMIRSGIYEQSELTGIQKEYDDLKTKIISADPSISKYINNVFGESYKNIAGKLSEKENIVTLSVGRYSTQIFLISKDKFFSKRIPLGKEEIKNMLSEIAPIFSDEMNNDGLYYNQDLFAFNAQASSRLYMNLFEPVIKEIPEGENIVFNLPFELALLPAEFLVTEIDETGSPYYYNDKKFLIDQYPVTYTPSVSVYLFQKEKKRSDNKTILLVGDPQIDNSDFSLSYRGGLLEDDSFNARNIVLFPLQYSKDEIDNVNTLIDDGYVLTSGNATEDNFKLNASLSKIIHLSTHSFLYKDQPLIMFSQNGDSQEDGYLESSEILQLELQSELVVLSSCKSGLGKIDEAEGILGMQKSFFEAGAKSIIVSLWDVNDKYTSYFMKSFYSFLSDGDDKNVALRKAKLYFKENYSANPYYWAAFVLSGDPYGVELQKSSGSSFLRTILILVLLTAVISIFLLRKRKTA